MAVRSGPAGQNPGPLGLFPVLVGHGPLVPELLGYGPADYEYCLLQIQKLVLLFFYNYPVLQCQG